MITLKEGTTGIAGEAFMGCPRLTAINIPNSVTSIGDDAFRSCISLASITVASDNPKYDSRNNCNAIIEIATNTLIGGCKNTIIPNSVASIGDNAFAGCNGLTSIVIPNSVTEIGHNAFDGCTGLTGIVVESGNTRFDSRNNCNAIIETADNTLIFGCKNTIIPNTVTAIGDHAFEDCTGLTSIAIPNSVTAIDQAAFFDCTGLTSIIIPESVTSIGSEAFSGCTRLTDVYCFIADLSGVSSWNHLFHLDNGDYSGRTLHVLQGTADDYRADVRWYWYFGQIVEDLKPDVPGDINGDRGVNIADVNAIINIILSGNGNNAAADVNGDGAINIADVNAIIDIILSGAWN